jgi:hypothetical protein
MIHYLGPQASTRSSERNFAHVGCWATHFESAAQVRALLNDIQVGLTKVEVKRAVLIAGDLRDLAS